MVVTLEFHLPEDQPDFDLAMDTARIHDAIYEFQEWLQARKFTKDGEQVKSKFFEILKQHGVELV